MIRHAKILEIPDILAITKACAINMARTDGTKNFMRLEGVKGRAIYSSPNRANIRFIVTNS